MQLRCAMFFFRFIKLEFFFHGLSLTQDPATSDDSGRASERLTGSSVAPRDADSSRDRLSDVSMTNANAKHFLTFLFLYPIVDNTGQQSMQFRKRIYREYILFVSLSTSVFLFSLEQKRTLSAKSDWLFIRFLAHLTREIFSLFSLFSVVILMDFFLCFCSVIAKAKMIRWVFFHISNVMFRLFSKEKSSGDPKERKSVSPLTTSRKTPPGT